MHRQQTAEGSPACIFQVETQSKQCVHEEFVSAPGWPATRLAKHDVLSVQPGRVRSGDEKLRRTTFFQRSSGACESGAQDLLKQAAPGQLANLAAVAVRPCIGHGEHERGMRYAEVLVRERAPINATTACPVGRPKRQSLGKCRKSIRQRFQRGFITTRTALRRSGGRAHCRAQSRHPVVHRTGLSASPTTSPALTTGIAGSQQELGPRLQHKIWDHAVELRVLVPKPPLHGRCPCSQAPCQPV